MNQEAGILSAAETQASGATPARILIVDDHPIVRQGYSLLIASQPDLRVCGEAASTAEAIARLGTALPHLIIVDVRLKDSDGMDLIKQVRLERPNVKILVVSALDEDLFADRVLQAGALGFINKQEATENLIRGIRAVLRGEVYLSERMTKRLLKRNVGTGVEEATSPMDRLSNRELQVFRLIGQGLSTKRIAVEMNLSPKTVERYRENIKSKLQLQNSMELVRTATQWVLESP